MGSHLQKVREIRKSLYRRARLRRNYFKMIGEDPRKKGAEIQSRAVDEGQDINLSDASDSDIETEFREVKPEEDVEKPKKLTGKQLASRKRAEKYHQEKAKEEELKRKQSQRFKHKKVMKSTTKRGQPKLGSQIGMLLDKIKQSEKK